MGKPQLSVEVGKADNTNESAPRRNPVASQRVWTAPKQNPSVQTVYNLFQDGCRRWANRKIMGQRKFIALHKLPREVKKKVNGEDTIVLKEWTYFELGDYSFITFAQFAVIIQEVASGLLHYGLKSGDKFSIYCRTSEEWMQTAIALASQTMTMVTAYENLGPSGLQASIGETEAKGVITDPANFDTILSILDKVPSLKLVVYRDTDGSLNAKQRAAVSQLQDHEIEVVSFTELRHAGRKHVAKPTPPSPEDIYCIMYTSGTTGAPKGVVLKHSNVVAGVAGLTNQCDWVKPSDLFMCVLPLAHIYEFTAELSVFVWGACLGYGTPKTLGEVNMYNCAGDMVQLRPTIMLGVPSLWEMIRKGVLVKVDQQSQLAQKVFWRAFDAKSRFGNWLPLVDVIIFRKIRKATGGRLRYIINGGANLAKDTRSFLSTAIAPLLMGYGITETNAMGTIMHAHDFELESTGQLVPSVTMKLVDFPDAGYYARNGQGEIYIKGPSVSSGYYKNEAETKDAFTEDGWFKTGDIGEWGENGTIRFIDRRKHLVKTLNGEYIALEQLESIYRSNKYVSNICVIANDRYAKPVGIIVPYEPALKMLCEELGRKYTTESVHDIDVYRALLASVQNTGRSEGLKSFQILPALAFSDEEWLPETGFVTHTQKLNRRVIQDTFHDEIEAAFKDTK